MMKPMEMKTVMKITKMEVKRMIIVMKKNMVNQMMMKVMWTQIVKVENTI